MYGRLNVAVGQKKKRRKNRDNSKHMVHEEFLMELHKFNIFTPIKNMCLKNQ